MEKIESNEGIMEKYQNDELVQRMLKYRSTISGYKIDMLCSGTVDNNINIEILWQECEKLFQAASMPYRFIFVLIMVSEPVTSLHDIKDQWDLDSYSDHDTSFNDSNDDTCICSHQINQVHILRNHLNSNQLTVGSECIHKFASDDLRLKMSFKIKALKYQQSGNGEKRQCLACGNHRIASTAEHWKTVCKSCYKSGAKALPSTTRNTSSTHRICSQCQNLTIAITAPSWKKLCLQCYKERDRNVSEETHRKCLQCEKLSISLTEPSWKKLCYNCYKT